jgi:hypothetical protein
MSEKGLPRIEPDAGYQKALEKLEAVTAELSRVERKREELLCELSEIGGRSADDTTTAAALAVLGDRPEGERPELRATRLRDEARALDERRRILQKAVELQRPEVERERARWSRLIVEKTRPAYVAIVRGVAEKLRALSDALASERALRESLIDNDVSLGAGGFVPMLGNLGDMRLDDENTRASWWMKDAKESGLI